MTIHIPKSEPQKQIEPGTYIARCYQMLEIGTTEYEYQGEKVQSRKIRITFELPTETKVFKEGEEAKPLVISGEYTLSFGKKSKLRPLLEGWRGKAFTEEEMENFDIAKLVGVPAFISVLHNEKGYAEISSLSKLPKGTECPPQINESQVLEYENFDEKLFEKLPEFLKKKIISTPEYRTLRQKQGNPIPYPSEESDPSGIPF